MRESVMGLGDQSDLKSFYVSFQGDDDDDWVVHINDEAHGWSPPFVARSISKGEEVRPEDIVVEQTLRPTAETDRYIRGHLDADSWFITMCLNHSHPRSAVHLEVGAEFFMTGTTALEQGLLRAFHTNAFHAAEHFAKAELLTYAAALPEIGKSRKHSHLRSLYQRWANLGNAVPAYARLLSDLTNRCGSVTYAEGEDPPNPDRAGEQHRVLKSMFAWVQQIVEGDGLETITMI